MSVDIRLNNRNFLGIEEVQMPTVQGGSATFEEPKTIVTKNITENGTYNASDDSADGYSEVNVNVPTPAPNLQNKSITITQNGTDTVTADSGYDGLGEVEITTNVSSGGNVAPNYVKFDSYNGQSLDISWLRTPNIDTMNGMFANCTNLTSLNLSNFNTSNVTNMGSMFSSCTSLTSLDLSNFNTSNVTSMNSMFEACTSLTSLDLSNFDTSNVTGMNSMFWDCNGLVSLDIRNFDFSSIDYDSEPGAVDSMFSGISSNCVIYVNQSTYDFIENDFNGDNVMGLDDLSMLQVVNI